MLLNKLISKKINIENNYNNNIIWGYIDIYKGNIIIYSPQMCVKIENNYKNNKVFINIDFLNTTIYFKNRLKQITNNKKYSVFRLITNNSYIEKNIFSKNDRFYEYNKQEHIGLLVNENIEHVNYYKNIVEDIIFKHKTEFSNNRFYCYRKNINIYNNTNLKNINNLDCLFDTYYEEYLEDEINCFNNTIYSQFINLLLHICKNYYDGEYTYIYILSTNDEFRVLADISNKLKNKNFINNNWSIISLNNIINESNEYNII
jgi:hypothetical protein